MWHIMFWFGLLNYLTRLICLTQYPPLVITLLKNANLPMVSEQKVEQTKRSDRRKQFSKKSALYKLFYFFNVDWIEPAKASLVPQLNQESKRTV